MKGASSYSKHSPRRATDSVGVPRTNHQQGCAIVLPNKSLDLTLVTLAQVSDGVRRSLPRPANGAAGKRDSLPSLRAGEPAS